MIHIIHHYIAGIKHFNAILHTICFCLTQVCPLLLFCFIQLVCVQFGFFLLAGVSLLAANFSRRKKGQCILFIYLFILPPKVFTLCFPWQPS